MVREVEELRAELQLSNAAQGKGLEERHVPLLLSRVIQEIARRVPERTRRWRLEGRWVEPEIVVRSVRELGILHLGVTNEIVRLTEGAVSDTRDVVGPQHRERRAGSEERRAGDRNSTLPKNPCRRTYSTRCFACRWRCPPTSPTYTPPRFSSHCCSAA